MNFKTTIVLIVLLAVVGIYLLVTRDSGSKSETTETQPKKVIDATVSDINKLTITPADGKRIVLEKTGVTWRMIEPVNASADTFEVDSLARAITELQSRGKMKVTADKASATGMDHPRFKVEIATNSKTQVLNVGERSAVGDNLYVFLGDSKEANVVGGDIAEKLEKPAETYRNKKLTDINQSDVKQLVITSPTTRIAAQKADQDWQITEPAKMPGEKSAIEDLLFAIAGLKAEEFVSEGGDVSFYALDQPRMTVFISKETPSTQPTTAPATQPQGLTIKFGRYDSLLKKNVMAQTSASPAIAKVQATILETLGKKPIELRDKRALTIDSAQVSHLTITSDVAATTLPTSRPASKTEVAIVRRKAKLVLGPVMPVTRPATMASTTQSTTGPSTTQAATKPAEPESKWQLASDEKINVDDAKVETLLTTLNPLRVEKYLESRPTTQPTATYTIKITTEPAGGTGAVQHEIHLTESKDQPLIGEYNGLVFEVDRSLVTKLQGDFKKSSAAAPLNNEAFPKHLGHRSLLSEKQLANPRSILDTFANPQPRRDYEIQFVFPEFTSVCPVTGQPDFATITIDYVPDKLCVEMKSLKLYFFSYRNKGIFYEAVVNTILDDVVATLKPRRMTVTGTFNVRGGTGATVTATQSKQN